MKGLRIERQVHFGRGRNSRKVLHEGPQPVPAPMPVGRIPRISKLMALALHFEQLIKNGEVADQAEIARLGQVSRARVTQIMNLLLLAPDIQEEILFLPRTLNGRDVVREHMVRPIAAVLDWRKQRRMWGEAVGQRCCGPQDVSDSAAGGESTAHRSTGYANRLELYDILTFLSCQV